MKRKKSLFSASLANSINFRFDHSHTSSSYWRLWPPCHLRLRRDPTLDRTWCPFQDCCVGLYDRICLDLTHPSNTRFCQVRQLRSIWKLDCAYARLTVLYFWPVDKAGSRTSLGVGVAFKKHIYYYCPVTFIINISTMGIGFRSVKHDISSFCTALNAL